MNHLCIDFETLGNRPDTAVLALGAILFNKTDILEEKLWHFDLQGQLEVGRRSVNAETLVWWMGQDDKAKKIFEKIALGGMLLRTFAPEFLEFASHGGPDVRVWANDTAFDTSIAEDILLKLGHKVPWKFWNRRCYRTMKACFGVDRKFEGTKHDPIDDSRHQAKCLQEFWAKNPSAEK